MALTALNDSVSHDFGLNASAQLAGAAALKSEAIMRDANAIPAIYCNRCMATRDHVRMNETEICCRVCGKIQIVNSQTPAKPERRIDSHAQ